MSKAAFTLCILFLLAGCSNQPANYPHGSYRSNANTFFSSFAQQPKTLDPAIAYSADEALFLGQVVEPPYQYDYLKRPYRLVPLTADAMPTIRYLNKQHQLIAAPSQAVQYIAYTQYRIHIKPHIYYQPHPAFAKDKHGRPLYLYSSHHDLNQIKTWHDFKVFGTRELTAEDYVYEIKRLANPALNSPLTGLLGEYIVGFKAFSKTLPTLSSKTFIDLRQYPLSGVRLIDRYTYEIEIKGQMQAFPYWLATSFFAPVPWEVDRLYAHNTLIKHNIGFSTYPVGTGAYWITHNNPNREIVLKKNPYFHPEYYPQKGSEEDLKMGYLRDAGKRLPFIDTFVFTLEKESIPRWSKFLQGYYDSSGIGADNFDEAVMLDASGKPRPSPLLSQKGIQLRTVTLPSIFYFGFNMSDPVVGGETETHRALRQAIAIAFDTQEYIAIFLNGRGEVAYSPIPPGIDGFIPGEKGINPYIATWQAGHVQPKSLADAKALLAKAGYPNGINPKTGQPLVLRYDAISGSGGDERAQFQWMKKQFDALGIVLLIVDTDYNRFQEKARSGSLQLFSWGWAADYPDPENFLFTLYGGKDQAHSGNENITEYNNSAFNRLFDEIKNEPPGPARDQKIQHMIRFFQQDTPWFSIFYNESYQLLPSWITPRKINAMANNTFKYMKIDPIKREQLQKQWNHAHYGWLAVFLLILCLSLFPFVYHYRKMQQRPPNKREKL